MSLGHVLAPANRYSFTETIRAFGLLFKDSLLKMLI